MHEQASAAIPYTADEYRWARCRPPADRTPIPAVGDEVFYRHNPWEPPTRAEVLAVQDLDDLADPNLWQVKLGPDGEPVKVEGRYLLLQSPDPWPELTLRTMWGIGVSREARLRGAPGWLPLDWASRHRPVPDLILVRAES